jgi:RimJ/RimL family protein N-acetyltransferase
MPAAAGWRRRGLATHAARLGADWPARQSGVHRVEARISQGDRASERVAVNAGEYATPVPPTAGTGQVADDMLYVLNRPGMGGQSNQAGP